MSGSIVFSYFVTFIVQAVNRESNDPFIDELSVLLSHRAV
jgi:hypothetical protein